MHIESLTLTNFQSFRNPQTIEFEGDLTFLIGPNGAGKTAVCHALLRIFGITQAERDIRVDDFHVPRDELMAPTSRSLRLEAVVAFPELDDPTATTSSTVPVFFQRMAAEVDGHLKVRVVLDSVWTQDLTAEGSIETKLGVLEGFDDSIEPRWVALPPVERARIQVIYVPSNRDGARQVSAFLRGRLWRAAVWSDTFADSVSSAATAVDGQFRSQAAPKEVEEALTLRWSQLHPDDLLSTPRFRPIEVSLKDLVKAAELSFEPDPALPSRPARQLSDGHRSLLHMALTSAVLDIESKIARGTSSTGFVIEPSQLPVLTLLVLEEPENGLTPFYLSRIVQQLQEVAGGPSAQAIATTHAPGALARIKPENLRHFRLDLAAGTSLVRGITLPESATDAGKYVREAVRAHPELYLARFVILGEGDSESLIIPRLAEAQGLVLDSSFAAMVPLGGRHTNHFWRLLDDLEIPHATLLDLDYGRSGAGALRVQDAFRRLADLGAAVAPSATGVESLDDIVEELDSQAVAQLIVQLRSHGVFFSVPLDLDWTMLRAYPDAYKHLGDGETGPQASSAVNAVIGRDVPEYAQAIWSPADTSVKETVNELLRWYRYRFLSSSKPSSHAAALSRLSTDQLAAPPTQLQNLIDYVRAQLNL